jgi:hypothetical protein
MDFTTDDPFVAIPRPQDRGAALQILPGCGPVIRIMVNARAPCITTHCIR